MLPNDALWLNCARPQKTISTNCHKPFNQCLCWQSCGRRPSCVDDAPLLHIGAEAKSDLVEIASKDRSIPNGGSIADGDLAGEHDVGGNIGIDGDLGEPLTEGDDLPLSSVVPFHSIWRFCDLRRRRWGCFGGESAAEEVVVVRGEG